MNLSSRVLFSFILATRCFAQPNVLNNGGFETGLMCYYYYISNNAIFGPSDYKVLLSTDAHSGNYSIELRCTGTDCIRAGVTSDIIPVQPSRDFRLSLYAKCPGNTSSESTIYLPMTSAGEQSSFITCNGTWTYNEILFSSGATQTAAIFTVFHYGGGAGPQSLLVDDVTLAYADGTAPAATVLYPGVRNVQVSGDRVLVDSAPYLALGYFDVNYDDLPLAAAAGANTAFGLSNNSSANCFNTTPMSFLDRAYQSGLNFIPDSTYAMRLNTAVEFPALIQQFAPHQANIAWMLGDEPDQTYSPWWEVDGPTFVAESAAAKTQTNLPIFADMQTSGAIPTGIGPYAAGVDFWMGEPYGTDFSTVQTQIANFKSVKQAPIWLAQDAIDASLIVAKAHWVIANGATGLVYFNWDQFKADPQKLAAATQAFSELNQLKNIIFSQNINTQVTASYGVAFQARYNGKFAYILSAYGTSDTLPAQFQVPGLVAGTQIQVMFENRTISANAGSFTDTFAGPSRHVYSFASPLASIAGTLTSKTGPDNERDWNFQIANGGLTKLNGASISSVAFKQSGGTACTPQAISLPVALGDIAPGASVFGDVMLNFSGCDSTAKFTVNIGLSANFGATTGSILRNNERK